ncbi:OstA-like protein [Sphingobacterium sp. 2149]|uniref:OstA-like protein n=1 Tax=Sphingobacterium sp. 2149 TaxID=2817763 RepID=UPI001B77F48A|nr:OstA-like protein [Sphingobacterium sp. 2149]MDR6737715.1 lipopolysaccharide export system protein LptA [Sphingobacterium sp. 2149]
MKSSKVAIKIHIFAHVKQYIYTLIVFILTGLSVQAQKQDELKLLSSSHIITGKDGNILFYRPVYEHVGSTLSSDSGYLHKDNIGRQFFEAFGNVIITQPDGTQIFSNKLHYEAAMQLATLTGAVRMVSTNGSILTTDHLVYNMRSKIGNYYSGGRILSGSDTITSQRATYFENTGESYFNQKVVVRSTNVKVYTDSMKYNGNTRITEFYGPTNIKGNKGENLYTEKGRYHMATGQAYFSKNNLYTEGTKFLKGDSLFYDRQVGIGKAVKNVVFVDTLDKFYAYGGFGLYNGRNESITMTDKPLIISVVKKDSTQKDSVSSLSPAPQKPGQELKKETKELKEIEKDRQKGNLKSNKTASEGIVEEKDRSGKNTNSGKKEQLQSNAQVDSVFMTADTLFSQMIFRKDYVAKDFKLDREGGAIEDDNEVDYGEKDSTSAQIDSIDALKTVADSLQKDLDSLHKKDNRKPVVEKNTNKVHDNLTNKKPVVPKKAPIIVGDQNKIEIEKNLKADSVLRKKAIIPKGGESDKLMGAALKNAKEGKSDSLAQDTAKTRIIKAYYNARLFKSDLQAVADSMYYGMQDSMFRLMGKPMMWAENSQISGDTIFLQVKNQKLDNSLLVGNAFMVNATSDSLKFNQIKGRKITSFFTNNRMERLFVDGNAENIFYNIDEKTNVTTELVHDRSSRFKILMEDNKLKEYVSIRKVDGKVYPIAEVTADKEFLPNFTWRPEDRPKSKDDLLNRKRDLSKASFTVPTAPEGEESGTMKSIKKGDKTTTNQKDTAKKADSNESSEKLKDLNPTSENNKTNTAKSTVKPVETTDKTNGAQPNVKTAADKATAKSDSTTNKPAMTPAQDSTQTKVKAK